MSTHRWFDTRLRLTALTGSLIVASVGALLWMSWLLLRDHLAATLPPLYSHAVLHRLAWQYVSATIGIGFLALGIGWLVSGRALAPLDTAMTRLERVLEAQRRFVANASHELRSPLTIIRTEAEVTLSDPEATEADLRRMGRIVLEASDRTEALLDSLLVLALSERGIPQREPVDLAALARRAADAVAADARREHVHLDLHTDRTIVQGDARLLERLVANLAENAVRHNEPGGFAHVRVETRDGWARVSAENSGPQVPPDALERLAEPFQRMDRVSAPRGSGLGLSIVRSVAEAHGGRLELSARHEGGLRAEVLIPS